MNNNRVTINSEKSVNSLASVEANVKKQIGAYGSTYINDTAANTGTWFCIIPNTDAVFTTLTDATRDGDALGAGVFPAGYPIYGAFTAITLASGSVMAYKSA